MNRVFLTLVLGLGWIAATGSPTIPNLLLGLVVGALALFVVRQAGGGARVPFRPVRLLRLAGLFVVELFASAVRVALLVLKPNLREALRPGIVAMPLRANTDVEITLLANLITLTPGTLSLDVSEDRRILYVHALDMADRDALVNDIAGGFERRIIEALR